MNNSIKFVGGLLLSLGLLAACGDDTNLTGGGGAGGGTAGHPNGGDENGGNPPTGGNGGTGGEGGSFMIPPKPELGAQIDRMGRPAINTALDGAFIQFNGAGNPQASDNATRATLEDDYNEDDAQNSWAATYTQLFAANLAILDSLDSGLPCGAGQTCNGIGNTVSTTDACSNGGGSCGDFTDATDCYTQIASFLTDDRLWLNTEGTDCSSSLPAFPEGYLAVELDLLGIPGADVGCGGRRPIDDVIDLTYTVVATSGQNALGDSVPAPAGLHPETFPYLADPF